jgi:hypothetical protein
VKMIKIIAVVLVLASFLACGPTPSARAKAIRKAHGGYGHVGNAYREAK